MPRCVVGGKTANYHVPDKLADLNGRLKQPEFAIKHNLNNKFKRFYCKCQD
jgi:hypothetical protein